MLIRDRRGREIRAEGLVAAYDIHFPFGPTEITFRNDDDQASYARDGRRRAEITLIELVSGVVVEARYTKQSQFACILAGGMGDWEHAKHVAELWLPTEPNPIENACFYAAAIVGQPMGWAAVKSMADQLYRCGRLEGEEAAQFCCAAFGGWQPEHDAWRFAWPPTLKQLRTGLIDENGEGPGVRLRKKAAKFSHPEPNGLATEVLKQMDAAIEKQNVRTAEIDHRSFAKIRRGLLRTS